VTVLVFGKTGQVAQALAQAPDTVCLDRTKADLSEPDSCARAIHLHRPSAVINAAAWTAVDAAETAEDRAFVINALAPAAMAQACADLGIPLVHLSTDYVFDGAGTVPFKPDHPCAPLGAYGRTKRAGEEAVIASGCSHAIVRTSWVFSAHGSNFVKTMLLLARTQREVSVVADQVGGPTLASAIAIACRDIARQLLVAPDLSGCYHFAGTPDVSWADFARAIFREASSGCDVRGIPTSDFPTPARRPRNSRLDCTTLHASFGIPRPDWRADLAKVVDELKETLA
jgi:dTDP-4-dehydrorhamnose reductase